MHPALVVLLVQLKVLVEFQVWLLVAQRYVSTTKLAKLASSAGSPVQTPKKILLLFEVFLPDRLWTATVLCRETKTVSETTNFRVIMQANGAGRSHGLAGKTSFCNGKGASSC